MHHLLIRYVRSGITTSTRRHTSLYFKEDDGIDILPAAELVRCLEQGLI